MEVGEFVGIHASSVAPVGKNRAVAQIEVTEETIRDQADASTFARGALLVGKVSGLSATGMLVAAMVDGMRVTARMPISGIDGGGPGGGLDGTCECPDPAPCAHAVAVLLSWVRSAMHQDDEFASLLADFEDVLADKEPDAEYLDELADDVEDLLDEDPAAVRELTDRVMNLIEARDDAGLSVPVMTGLLERLDELYLEARQLAGPKS
jgi:uncharacterized Zn finger protein